MSEGLALLVAALLATGAAAGFLAGLLGVGGGIVMVPVLYQVFTVAGVTDDARMHMAVGTSLAAMIPTSIRSALGHHAKGAVDTKLLRLWGPAAFLGAVAGASVGVSLEGEALSAVFAVLALAVSLHMAFVGETQRLASTLPPPPIQALIAGVIGALSVMMGIGGGTFTVPTLIVFNTPIHRAVGTAAALGVLIAIPGAIAFTLGGIGAPDRPIGSFGYVSLLGVLCLAPATVLSAPWGVKAAHRLDTLWLRRAFALFLALTGLRMALG